MYNTTNYELAQVSLAAAYIVIELFAISGNILIIYAICNSRRLKTNYYFLVFHLAICDIAIVVFGNTIFTFPLYNLSSSSIAILYRVSTFVNPFVSGIFVSQCSFLVIIAVLRYRAVTQPLQPQITKKALNYAIAGVYTMAIILQIPFFLKNEDNKWYQSKYFKIYQCIWESSVTLLPFTLFVGLYSVMCRSLLLHNKRIKELCSSGTLIKDRSTITNIALQRNYRTLVISIIVVVQYFASVLPARVVHMLKINELIANSGAHASWVMMVYYLGNCTLNSVIYGLGDKAMRAAYFKVVKNLIFKKVSGHKQ